MSAYLLACGGCGGRDSHIGAAIYGVHFTNLLLLVLVVVLNDAHGIDPEISETDAPGDGHGILNGPWERVRRNVPLVVPDSRPDSFGHLIAAPAVAQRSVRRNGGVCGEPQPERWRCLVDLDDSLGHEWAADGMRPTVGVVTVACVQPATRPGKAEL